MKKLIAVLLSSLLVLSLAACGGGASSVSTPPPVDASTPASSAAPSAPDAGGSQGGGSQGGGKIGMLLPTLQVELFAHIANECEAYFTANGYEFTATSYDDDVTKAIEVIENFTTSDVDLIVGLLFDEAANDALLEAKSKGIKIAMIGTGTEGVYDLLMSTDHAAIGREIAQQGANFINNNLGGTAKVAAITSDANIDNIIRTEALLAGLAELCPDAELVSNTKVLQVGEATNAMENILQQHPDVQVVLTLSDPYAIEVAEVMNAAGMNGDEYCVIGADGSQQAYKMISEGSILRATVALGDTVTQIINGCVGLLDGTITPPAEDFVEIHIVTPENVADFMQ